MNTQGCGVCPLGKGQYHETAVRHMGLENNGIMGPSLTLLGKLQKGLGRIKTRWGFPLVFGTTASSRQEPALMDAR